MSPTVPRSLRLHPAAALWQIRPARKRPKRLKIANPGASAAERLRAATQTQVGGQVLTGLSPEQAAQSIYDALCEQGVVKLKS